MRSLIKGWIIAFSMYSKLPVPHLEWKEADMRYTICFFPLVGAVIGILCQLWFLLCDATGAGALLRLLVAAVLPLLVTGGIHLDGLLDTGDALHSYREREKKLEILKDSHIGAFAVITLVGFSALWLGGLSELTPRAAGLWCVCFFLSRCLSGLSVVSFQNARADGTLHTFSSLAQKRVVRGVLAAEFAAGSVLLLVLAPAAGAVCLLTALLVFRYYDARSKKEFGGITGDVAGWFLCLCELGMTLALAGCVLAGLC